MEYRDHSNPFIHEIRDDGMAECSVGLIPFPCIKQDLSFLEQYVVDDNKMYEFINGTIDVYKFTISFEITFRNGNFNLASCSKISLRTYEIISSGVDKWGEFDSIEKCMDKATSVISEFRNYFSSYKEVIENKTDKKGTNYLFDFLLDLEKSLNWRIITLYFIILNVATFYNNIEFLKLNGSILCFVFLAYLISKIDKRYL